MLEGEEGREGEMSAAPLKEQPAATVVASSFVEQYYKVLATDPSNIHRFYSNDSVFSRIDQHSQLDECTVVGQINVHAQIRLLEFEQCKVLVHSIDCQESLDGSVLVLVTGLLSNKGQTPRRFMQTVLLARQERGFYVRNDCLRYIDANEFMSAQESVSVPVEETREEEPVVPEPVEEVPEVAVGEPQTEIQKQVEEPVPEQIQEEISSAAPVSVPSEERIIPQKPMSWASRLFAGQSVVPPPVPEQPVPQPPQQQAEPQQAEPQQQQQKPVKPPRQQKPQSKSKPAKDVESTNGSVSHLFVSNIPEDATEQSVRSVFEQFGRVARVELRDGRAFCFVVFDSPDGVTAALQSDTIILNGQQLSVEPRKGRRVLAERGGRGGRGRYRFVGGYSGRGGRFSSRGGKRSTSAGQNSGAAASGPSSATQQ